MSTGLNISWKKVKNAVGALSVMHWGVIALSLALTLFAWWYSSEQMASKIKLQFDKQADQVVRLVIDRMKKYEDALWGGVSYFYAVNNKVSYSSWKSYVESLNIVNKYPGINGMGVIFSLQPDELETFLKHKRRERFDFRIHPQHKKKRFLPITYIIPVKGNEQAVGLDMAFEQNRFTAALKAEKTGTAQLTRPIVLVQDQQKTPGFLLFAPIYSKKSLDNAEDRKANFIGMVYAPFIMKKLMHGTLAQENRDISIKISDKQTVLFNELAENGLHFDKNAKYRKQLDINIYGQTWTFDLWSSSSFAKAAGTNQPYIILLGGIIIDVLLLILFIQMSGAKKRAIDYAESLNLNIKKQAKKHATLNKRLELALSASHVGVWEYDLLSKDLIWDEGMYSLYNLNKENVAGTFEAWQSALHPDDKERMLTLVKSAVSNNKRFDISFRIQLPDKRIKVIRALGDVVFENGSVRKMVGVNWDITDVKDKEAQLEHLAKYDALSQLKNRFSFNESCKKLINRAKKNNRKFALLLIDIDDFKQINDLYGHQMGDNLISLMAKVIQNNCRDRDLVFRLGGDEFAVLTDCIEDGIIVNDIAERIIAALHKPFDIEGNKIKSSCSIGIAIFPHAGVNADELMMNADIALYKSKHEGKDCINYFTEALNEKATRLRFIKNNLINAVAASEIFMNYQPIVDIRTNRTFAFEALARWTSGIGMISPDEFIAVAEKNNSIKQLGEMIVEQVASDISGQSQDVIVSINCSSKQLVSNGGFCEMLFDTLKKYRVPAEKVILEITETYLIRDYKEIRESLEEINSKGVDIAIDDFGTGYSSLSLLANIPFQYLKIDREFVTNIHTAAGFKVLQCIYNVAMSLNKKIIAEGVETQEQMDKLLAMGIYLIQGNYFSKPVNMNETSMLKEH